MTADGDGTAPAAGIDERIAERRREVRRQRQLGRRRRTITVAVVLVVAAVLFAVERSPLVGLERIEVAGTERLTSDQVREAAALELGTSTLRLRLGAVEERVRELPLVRNVTARRTDPLTVHIEVVERVPAIRVRGDQDVILDREGVVLGPTGDLPDVPDGVLPIRVPGETPPPGDRPAEGTPLAGAVATWRALSGPLRVEVTEVAADRRGDLQLTLRSGTQVRWGPAERTDEKVRALGAVLEDLGATVVEAVDVTAPGRPAVEP